MVITTISGHHNIAATNAAILAATLPITPQTNSQPSTLAISPLSLLTLHTTKNLATPHWSILAPEINKSFVISITPTN